MGRDEQEMRHRDAEGLEAEVGSGLGRLMPGLVLALGCPDVCNPEGSEQVKKVDEMARGSATMGSWLAGKAGRCNVLHRRACLIDCCIVRGGACA